MLVLLMESMLVSSPRGAVLAGVGLPGLFGERMRECGRVRVRSVSRWRGVAGQQAATAGAHSLEKSDFLCLL